MPRLQIPLASICLFLLMGAGSLAAQPVADVDLLFSTDDGANYLDVATVDEMTPFSLRIYFDNTGDAAAEDAAVTFTLPAGFVRTPASTRVCLEPTDGEIVCSEDAGQSGAIDESAVWSGQTLTISPSAGLYGAANGAVAGPLEIGKAPFLNLHDCHYFNGAERFFTTADPDIAGTNISDTIDAAAACAGTVGAYGNAGQELRTVGLLGQRYFNFHECHYNFFTDHIYRDTDGTATRTSNTLDAAFNCAGTAGAHILHPDSVVINFDLLGQRYLNFWECRYINGGDLISLNSVGSNTSSTPDAAPSCPATLGAYTLNDSDLLALDTLDTTRGRGFVEVEVTAATTGDGDFDFDTTLGAPAITDETDQGTVTVIGAIVGPMPTADLRFSQDCTNTFGDEATPYPGEEFFVRVYFDNVGDEVAADSRITTTLPAGLTLVPDSTRMCLTPTADVEICNTDPGQGGAIDEDLVWSGDTLEVAPGAGLEGVAPDAQSGALPFGSMRYLNIHECHYFDGFGDRLFLSVSQGATGTNVSNSIDTAPICPPVAHGRTLVDGAVTTYDLQAQRYLNIHECHYQFFFLDRILLNGSGFTATAASNTIDAMVGCDPAAGAHSLLAGESNLLTVDLAGQRYLNLHECVMLNGADHIGLVAGPANGTNASNVADELAQCPSTSGAHSLVAGSVTALDRLDPTRAGGFVEFQVTAASTVVDEVQTATLSGTGFDDIVETGTIRATASKIFFSGFECGDLSEWDELVLVP